MKKFGIVVLVLLLMAASSFGTFYWMNSQTLTTSGDKMLITNEHYDKLKALEKKYEDLEELKDILRATYYKNEAITDELLMEGAKKGMFSILGDPYTVYMNKEEYQALKESIGGSFPGIGVIINPNPDLGIEIVSPIEGTPAFRAGLKSKDIIKSVNGVQYSHLELDVAVKNIRGPVGESVTLEIYRPSENRTFEVVIVREIIHVEAIKSGMLIDDIGYLRMTQFDEDVAAEFEKHMDALIESGAKKLILDLRDNPGGALGQCIEISDMLTPPGLLVTTEGPSVGAKQEFQGGEQIYDMPMIVLINNGSASCSEILTGVLKELDRATVIGTTSYGKGVVQTVLPHGNDGNGMKITISEYFVPNKTKIHGVGVKPHIELELSKEFERTEAFFNATDNQLMKAIEVLKSQN